MKISIYAVAIAAFATPGLASASSYRIIYDLAQTGSSVDHPLAADPAGNLYGINTAGDGLLFRLTPPAPGMTAWTEADLFDYASVSAGNSHPNGVTLIPGAVIGTNSGSQLDGTAYRLSTAGLVNLHVFAGSGVSPMDGIAPLAPLTAGPYGLFYGTTSEDSPELGAMTAFQISSSATNPQYEIIHVFNNTAGSGDGFVPSPAALVAGPNATLYGVTEYGGVNRNADGTVYTLTKTGGVWQEKLIHSFSRTTNDLQQPMSNVVLDSAGNVYGCATYSPISGSAGAIFRLAPPPHPSGNWVETVLYTFGTQPNDPIATAPFQASSSGSCGVAFDAATGRLLGTAPGGGAFNKGAIFELSPPAAGQTAWTETVLHSFDGSPTDGANPLAAPVKVGGTYYGGTYTGSIYAFTP